MWNGFFINSGINATNNNDKPSVSIDGSDVIVYVPDNVQLDLYMDSDNNVFAGSTNNNSKLIIINENEIYARRVS